MPRPSLNLTIEIPEDDPRSKRAAPAEPKTQPPPKKLRSASTDSAPPLTPSTPALFSPVVCEEKDTELNYTFFHHLLTRANLTKDNPDYIAHTRIEGGWEFYFGDRTITLTQTDDELGSGAFGVVNEYEAKEGKDILTLAGKALCDTEASAKEIKASQRFCTKKSSNYINQYLGNLDNIIFSQAQDLSLEDYIQAMTDRDLPQCAIIIKSILYPVAKAINLLNYDSKGFHLDLKAANIFLSTTLSKPKIGDFGCSMSHTEIKRETLAGKGNLRLYSPEWASDSVNLADLSAVSKATDSWALGLLIKALLGLKSPMPEFEDEFSDSAAQHTEWELTLKLWGEKYKESHATYIEEERELKLDPQYCDLFHIINEWANQLLNPEENRLSVQQIYKIIDEFVSENLDLLEGESEDDTPKEEHVFRF